MQFDAAETKIIHKFSMTYKKMLKKPNTNFTFRKSDFNTRSMSSDLIFYKFIENIFVILND